MKAWSSFYPDLLMHVPGCPDILADQALCRSAREFFQRTFAWQEWLDPITTSSTTREYDMDAPMDSVILRIERATLDGNPFDVQSIRTLDKDPTVHTFNKPGLATLDRQQIVLTQEISDSSVLRIQVSLMPTTSADGLPNAFFEQYMEEIIHGAKYRLMAMTGEKFGNPELAALARGEFERGINTKAVTAWRGNTGKTPRARLRLC